MPETLIYPREEPLWEWDTETLLQAEDLIEWAVGLPHVKRVWPGHCRDTRNPRLIDGRLIGVASKPGQVFAASPDDGSILWQTPLGQLARGDQTAADATGLFGGLSSSLTAVRFSDGLLGAFHLFNDSYSRPAVSATHVFASDIGGWVYKIAKGTGEAVWSRRVARPGIRVNGSPALLEDLVIVGTNAGRVVACDVESGEVRWRTNLETPITEDISTLDGRVFVNAGSFIAELDAERGKVLRTWVPDGEQVCQMLPTTAGIFLVLRALESVPTPLAEQMKYQPERLMRLSPDFRRLWVVDYPPYASPCIVYDPGLETIIEATRSGLGFVDTRTGIRRCVIHNFPRKSDLPEQHVCLPVRDGRSLYMLGREGVLAKLRKPVL